MSSSTAVLTAVLVMHLPLPALAHDIYSELRDEVGRSCCNDRDCHPALYRVTASGVQMFVDQRWIDVPEGQIQYRALPGDTGETYGGHWCGSPHDGDTSTPNTLYMTKCAILPPQSASAQDTP
jgi:hypothetical protein